MREIAKFKKISGQQLEEDAELFLGGIITPDDLAIQSDMLYKMLANTPLPKRATKGSAGYDIYSPVSRRVKAGEPFIIPTGLRCLMNDKYFLMIVPRSGLGFKYGLRLVNTSAIIDADFGNADNEGHILLKFVADKDFEIHAGDRIAQGIFLKYGITVDDAADGERHGGFGSTDEVKKDEQV